MSSSGRHVALLRAVNVGGRNLVSMAALRAVFEALGHSEVQTHLQSGNAVFAPEPHARLGSPAAIAADLERAFEERFGFATAIVLRAPEEMTRIASAHPFAANEAEAAKLHVVFLKGDPEPGAVAALDGRRSASEEFEVRGREIYVWYGDGAGRSKLTFDRLGTPATARNWNTVTRLAALATAS